MFLLRIRISFNDNDGDDDGDNYENIVSDNNLIYIVPFQAIQSLCLSVYKQLT